VPPAIGTRLPGYFRGNDAHAFHAPRTDHFEGVSGQGQRLAAVGEIHAFFARMRDFADRAGHADFVAPVHAGDFRRAQAHRGAHAIHGGIAAAEHDHAAAGHVARLIRIAPV